jgi:hypothetical membrane protein
MSPGRLGLYCGIVAPVAWLALLAIAGALRPDFSPLTHFISELGARGSSTELLTRAAAFGFTGLLYVCFAIGLRATFRPGLAFAVACFLIALEGIGRMGAGIFPCDPGCVRVTATQDLHKLFATVGFLSGILAAILWGILFVRLAAFRSLSRLAIGCGVAALLSLLLMSWDGNPWGSPGLFEHLATVLLSIWLLLFAVRAVRTVNANGGTWPK